MKRVPSSRRDITGILFSNILDILRYIFGERSVTDCSTDEDTFGRVVDRRFALLSKHAEDSMWRGFPRVWRRGPRQFQQRGRKEGRYLRNVNTGGGDDNATSGPEASVKKRTNPFELAVLMKN